MTTYQEQFQGRVVLAPQSARGTIAATNSASAKVLPIVSGSVKTSKQTVASMQVRGDGLPIRGRHGQRSFTASYKSEMQDTNFDDLLAALLRTTWTTPSSITEATGAMSSATMSATGHVITFSGGDVRTAGLRVYDVVRFTVGLATADLQVPLRITGLTATTITVAEALTTVAGPVSAYTFTVYKKKLSCPASGSLVNTYFTLEEYEIDQDTSTVAQDVRIGKVDISMQPNSMVSFDMTFLGTGNVIAESTGNSPYFTAQTTTTSTPLSVIDATISLNGTDQVDLTGFNISIDLGLTDSKVVGAVYSPDVFAGVMKVSASVTALRKDLAAFTDFLAESTYSINILLKVPGTSPQEYMSITIPYCSLGSCDPSDLKREGGPRTQTINIPAELVGVDPRGTGYDSTIVKFQVSNT